MDKFEKIQLVISYDGSWNQIEYHIKRDQQIEDQMSD
jgi:hypothetical protein